MSDTTTTVFIKADASGVESGAKKAAKSLDKVKKEGQTLGGAFKNLSSVTDALNINFGGMGVNIGMAKAAFGQLQGSMRAATASTRAFSMALVSTGIGAIVVALGTLFQAFISTQQGADTLARVMEPLRAGFAAVWGVIQNFATPIFQKLFDNPKKALQEFWALSKTALQDSFRAILKGIVDDIKLTGKNFQMLGLNIKKMVASIPYVGEKLFDQKKLEDDINAVAKEMDDLAESRRANFNDAFGVDLFRQNLRAIQKEIREAYESGLATGEQIAAIEKQIMQARINSTVPLAKARNELADLMLEARKLKDAGEDTTAVQEKMRETIRQISDLERGVLQLELRRLQLKNSLNDTNDQELLQMEELKKQLIDIERQEKDRLRSVERFRDTTKQANDELEKTPELLDKASDSMDPLQDKTGDIAKNIEHGLAGGLMAVFNAQEDRGKAMLRFLAQMAARLAASAVAAKAISVLFPGAAAAGGVARAAIPGFANGTPYAPGGLSVVGERGPELVSLPQGARVSNTQKTRSMMSGGRTTKLDGEFTVRGSDLVLALNRTKQRQSR